MLNFILIEISNLIVHYLEWNGSNVGIIEQLRTGLFCVMISFINLVYQYKLRVSICVCHYYYYFFF